MNSLKDFKQAMTEDEIEAAIVLGIKGQKGRAAERMEMCSYILLDTL